jgi:hypothetical protein
MPMQAPLSFQQQWLWSLATRYPGWNCVLTYAFRLSGPLQVEILETCLEQIVRRHGALRTTINTIAGRPQQHISEPGPVNLDIVTLSADTEQTVSSNAQALLEDFCSAPIPASARSLWQVRLIRLDSESHLLAFAVHRLATDCFGV